MTDRAVVLADGHSVLIDADSAHWLERYKWSYRKHPRRPYVIAWSYSNRKTTTLYLHRLILGLKPGEICDHINGDTLDNRLCNLRLATPLQNNQNLGKKPSKHGNRFKGINTRSHGFQSQIRVNGRIVFLGTFRTDVEAAYAYDMASLQHHGEYGRRNFLPLVRAAAVRARNG